MNDDNIFDEDDALDYIMYEENTKQPEGEKNSSGCLTGVIFFVVSSLSISYSTIQWILWI